MINRVEASSKEGGGQQRGMEGRKINNDGKEQIQPDQDDDEDGGKASSSTPQASAAAATGGATKTVMAAAAASSLMRRMQQAWQSVSQMAATSGHGRKLGC